MSRTIDLGDGASIVIVPADLNLPEEQGPLAARLRLEHNVTQFVAAFRAVEDQAGVKRALAEMLDDPSYAEIRELTRQRYPGRD